MVTYMVTIDGKKYFFNGKTDEYIVLIHTGTASSLQPCFNQSPELRCYD
jgi:hypothetical protein